MSIQYSSFSMNTGYPGYLSHDTSGSKKTRSKGNRTRSNAKASLSFAAFVCAELTVPPSLPDHNMESQVIKTEEEKDAYNMTYGGEELTVSTLLDFAAMIEMR